ncbi:hypothetical protein ST37_02415 [Vibrio sp. qd031]|uniref:hypothetical protein n=1 Tax=Vibrio sp. qd031 TaxID=1603038 RepID=UPI000A11124A|nr:hypothetical protein [Vibrio sp. qd031]ORT52207.1 hypothetical protein ST37_02415 [Vibrio sp. qd031]
MNCIEIIQVIKDIALAGAAITTAIVAYQGLKSWRRELEGKAEFEIARALVLATYKLRDSLKLVRSPWIHGHEFPDDYPLNMSERTPDIEAKAFAHIYTNRWKPVVEALQNFDVQSLEGEALWGSASRDKTNEMRQCARNLQVSIEAFIHNKAENNEDFKSNKEFKKSIEADVWGTESEDNKLTQQINAAVENLEKELRPYLKRS